jgi:cob(I)alamin adenosyltransferase
VKPVIWKFPQKRLLGPIQNHLFDQGADLALPDSKKDSNSICIKEKDLTYLKKQIGYYNNKLSKPTSLI